MTTTLRRWPGWAFAAALMASAGCGQPPPMVSMRPPGSEGDPLTPDLSGDDYRAQALGETPIPRDRPPGETDPTVTAGFELPEDLPPIEPLEPTEPGQQVETDSGLVYSTIQPGDPDGPTAEVGDVVTAHYTGTLDDGTVFDSSEVPGREPMTFPIGPGNNLISGWNVGIPGMKRGERRKLVLPPELAYGDRGSPPTIPPGATLTFEIELTNIRKSG